MLKIRGISNAGNLLTGVNRFGHCLTGPDEERRVSGVSLKPDVILVNFQLSSTEGCPQELCDIPLKTHNLQCF
jgi:hypothetical protein